MTSDLLPIKMGSCEGHSGKGNRLLRAIAKNFRFFVGKRVI